MGDSLQDPYRPEPSALDRAMAKDDPELGRLMRRMDGPPPGHRPEQGEGFDTTAPETPGLSKLVNEQLGGPSDAEGEALALSRMALSGESPSAPDSRPVPDSLRRLGESWAHVFPSEGRTQRSHRIADARDLARQLGITPHFAQASLEELSGIVDRIGRL